MAISRLLYSQQTCIISVGGLITDVGALQTPPVTTSAPYQWEANATQAVKDAKHPGIYGASGGTPVAKNPLGFQLIRNWLLPVQSASVDETIPQEDVLVMGKLGATARVQKDVATCKCTVKAYLADYMQWWDSTTSRDAGIFSWNALQLDGSTPPALTEQVDEDGSLYQMGYTDAAADGTWPSVDYTGGVEPDPTITGTGAGGLGDSLGQNYGTTYHGPFPGITNRGFLAGENWIMNGHTDLVRQGLLEQLIWESMGGYESVIRLFAPTEDPTNPAGGSTADGFTFLGILSSISVDASKGAYPTIDLNFEGVGEVQFMQMNATDFNTGSGGEETAEPLTNLNNAGDWFVEKLTPHTSDDVAVWGRDMEFNTTTGAAIHNSLTLIAGNTRSYYMADDIIAGTGGANSLSKYGDDVATFQAAPNADQPATRIGDGIAGVDAFNSNVEQQGEIDTLSSAKMSFDMPTETLSALGEIIEGNTMITRAGNATFSKPPYKATLNLDGQGLKMAGTEVVVQNANNQYVTEEMILPNEIQIGQLHCVIEHEGAAVSSRSMNQNVGDVGASYSVAVEGTMATFRSNYQSQARDILA